MKILVTNDDGIFSEGIKELADSLSSLGDVWVVAPDRERNAISHALTLHRPLRILNPSCKSYAVNGTPADCVNVGVNFILKGKPDLVVSGINKGENLGGDINYSGTVAAAVEGALMGIQSFAISLSAKRDFNFKPAAAFALKLARFITKKGLPAGSMLNVNVPDTGGKEINLYKITKQGKDTHDNTIEEKVDPRGVRYYWIGRKDERYEDDDVSDLKAISQKLVSITPLQIDRTHCSSFEELLQWDL
ncbi:MAG: 5'/3'-nucleotidase SurE [Deltaproteobacteria bacterium]|nr:5'/3'-nucleotidase SurE [Deltaproteobacteria bacterium]MBW2651582.1 5'/3'-nucleotidase SurE [Deltaproteobacteria bacterium]MCK5010832.1 5'/3'-nucleotidase SurE [Deltaproteobacteria bacterium]MCK5186528.1 5'/3'-nucleotidase SurE [Deltaproteobacteria bacterium]MCK5422831.1 5'/3'-nucleotidase SurE [Deltaproteobacteria bacterium]